MDRDGGAGQIRLAIASAFKTLSYPPRVGKNRPVSPPLQTFHETRPLWEPAHRTGRRSREPSRRVFGKIGARGLKRVGYCRRFRPAPPGEIHGRGSQKVYRGMSKAG